MSSDQSPFEPPTTVNQFPGPLPDQPPRMEPEIGENPLPARHVSLPTQSDQESPVSPPSPLLEQLGQPVPQPFPRGTCLDGKYVIERELGQGGYGLVLLAKEIGLDRDVALKLPRPDIAWTPEQLARFRDEARTVARLQERGIATIYQIFDTLVLGRPSVCVVQQYIPGTSLSRWWRRHQDRLDAYDLIAQLLADTAAIVATAHSKGLFHRDLKPDNILIDTDGRPYVLDFGLALHVSERTRSVGMLAGTVPYMAPEQVRGETQKIDARTDIWALGVILYQILAGRRPFQGPTTAEVFEAIKQADPQPPRQIRSQTPAELERIALKCLAKVKGDRYASMADFERDLRSWRDAPAEQSTLPHRSRQNFDARSSADSNSRNHGGGSGMLGKPLPAPGDPPTDLAARFVTIQRASEARSSQPAGAHGDAMHTPNASRSATSRSAAAVPDSAVTLPVDHGSPATPNSTLTSTPSSTPNSSSSSTSSSSPPSTPAPGRIVPKGLRSFDGRDADFFLELLPGVRERNLLPSSINFWKERIEADDPELRVPVGLLFGPSGCGKSSLMKAGLLPRLKPSVIAVYLEATQDDTESRLLSALRHKFPEIPADLGLVEALAEMADGRWLPPGGKLLIVLDQFEQWLYAHRGDWDTPLRNALGQCDGARLQAILMVRNDFWTPASELLKQLDFRLQEGANSESLPLFSPAHAKRVLLLFGRAYGCLPATDAELSEAQQKFLDAAIAGLAEDDQVICVRVALFADMFREREWTMATLHTIGGVKGVGAAFLEESLAAKHAPPSRKRHLEAAKRVLKSLLPPLGTEIKGHCRSREELATIANYTGRPDDMLDLLRILDTDLRLITPAASDAGDASGYQLTHDYLVPSLREWLTRKQGESARGRAELRLEERSTTWNSKPENRYLPSLAESLRIAALTTHRDWSAPQRRMMRRALRIHLLRATIACCFLGLVAWAGWEVRERQRVGGLVAQLTTTTPDQILGIIDQLDASPNLADQYLKPKLSAVSRPNSAPMSPEAAQAILHTQLAAVRRDPTLVEPLRGLLLNGNYAYAIPIRERLRSHSQQLLAGFRDLLHNENAAARQRFGAAIALAADVPVSDREVWNASSLTLVTRELVSANPAYQPELRRALRPIGPILRADLERIFVDSKATESQRLGAAHAIVEYAARDIPWLTQLLLVASPEQYELLFPLVSAGTSATMATDIAKIAGQKPADSLGPVERVTFGQRRASAAVTLLLLGEHESAMSVFSMTDDQEALSQFTAGCRQRGVNAETLLDCLELVSSAQAGRYTPEARYGLMLALGEFPWSEIPESRRASVLEKLKQWYASDPNSGIHGASGWLLRQWGESAYVTKIDETEVPYSPDREWFTLAVTVKPPENIDSLENPLYRSPPKSRKFYYTFVVYAAGDYQIGSVPGEPGQERDEVRHTVKLTRPFAILNREITFAELLVLNPLAYGEVLRQLGHPPENAAVAVSWYDAVLFCRWLGMSRGDAEADQAYPSPELASTGARESDPNAAWAPRDWPVDLSRRGFRLPTDAEWEVACRGGVRTAFSFGGDSRLLGRYAWYNDSSEGRPHNPCELRPNARGMFDLHGNAVEWTHDWYQAYHSPLAVTDPIASEGSSMRCFRGGSWSREPSLCRSSVRGGNVPPMRSIQDGFRPAMSLVGVPRERVAQAVETSK